VVAKAGFQPLPFKSECFDVVRAHHVLEHIPRIGYRLEDGRLVDFNPVIELFNEVCRVLKRGGKFKITVPIFPHAEAFIDPTHVSVWTSSSFQYFTKTGMNKELYGIETNFEISFVKQQGYCAIALLVKP